MKTKQRLLLLLLSIAIVFTFMPASAFVAYAAEEIPIDEDHFSDAAFREYLTSTYGSSVDPTSVTELDVPDKGIESLEGIQYFTALEKLCCYKNNLSSLDVSNNTALVDLDCRQNNLNSLDVSNNTALVYLYCNDNNLNSLDVNKNTALVTLSCSNNNLNSLDVSNNTALVKLSCSQNNLNSLDVSNNTDLFEIYCIRTNLSSLDVSCNEKLSLLWCGDNNLNSLDVSHNTLLANLDCAQNNLTSLDVSNNTNLKQLYCYYNNLNSLDVSNNTRLMTLNAGNNNLSMLDVDDNTKLGVLSVEKNNLSMLDVSHNTRLSYLDCRNNSLGKLYIGDKQLPDECYYDTGVEIIYGEGSVASIPMPKTIKLSATKYVYDGKVKMPTVTVTDANGSKLVSGTDYDVTYQSGRKKVGKYSVTVKMKGAYTGSKTLTFKIYPKPTTLSKVIAGPKGLIANWKKMTTQTTGYVIQYSTDSKFKSGCKEVRITSNKTLSKVIIRLKAKKKYYIRIKTYKHFDGYNLYSTWSKAKAVTTKDFTPRTQLKGLDSGCKKRAVDLLGVGLPNCTTYALARALEIKDYNYKKNPNYTPPFIKPGHSNAVHWWNNNKKAKKPFPTGKEPMLGAIAVWSNGGAGHVAVVEGINSKGVVYYSHSNYGSRDARGFSWTPGLKYPGSVNDVNFHCEAKYRANGKQIWGFNEKLLGYIYVN